MWRIKVKFKRKRVSLTESLISVLIFRYKMQDMFRKIFKF